LTDSNRFHNSFQFDDAYATRENHHLRDLHNVPLSFRDAGASRQPTLPASPARLVGRQLLSGARAEPFLVSPSIFFWYLVQLHADIFLLPQGFCNGWVAFFVTPSYGPHPAMAETVNYIMQRAAFTPRCR
jgi:hypothetical protein